MPADADIFVALNERHGPTAGCERTLGSVLHETYPASPASPLAFLPADSV